MKCIKNTKNSRISRVRDEAAKLYVKAGTHQYVPKAEWKEAGRP